MARLLVTGGSGFVGARLLAAARSRGVEVAAASADVREPASVAREIADRRPDVVVHGAAVTDGALREIAATNVVGTENVARACAVVGVGRLVLLSSGAVYGAVADAEVAVPEGAPLRGANPYAISKIAAERSCRELLRVAPVELLVVRLGTLYGETERATDDRPRTSPLHRLAGIVREQARIAVSGLEVRRSYCHVDDACDALIGLATASASLPGILNLDGGERSSLDEVLEVVRSLRPDLVVGLAPTHASADFVMTPADERPALDVRRLERVVSWSRRPLARGLAPLLGVAPEQRGG